MTKAFVSALCALLFACGPAMRDDGLGDGDGDGSGDGSGSGSGTGSGEARQCDKMDIVFVVDNSGSMQEEQSNLATNFPMFASLLDAYTVSNGQPLDYRVALTTTGRDVDYQVDLGGGFGTFPQSEKGQNGEFYNTCNNTKRWLDRSDTAMSQTLACRANVGTGGPSIEMPLLMSKWALAERAADTNAGFIRPDALLAIVVLTDEDDASTTENNFTLSASGTSPTNFNPSDLVQFLDTTKGNRTLWAAGVIAGDGNCSSSFGDAADGVRLKEFVNLANGNGSTQAVFSSICNGDLTKGLKDALDTFSAACGAIIL